MNYQNSTYHNLLEEAKYLCQDNSSQLNLSTLTKEEIIKSRNYLIIDNLENYFNIEIEPLKELHLQKIQLKISFRTEHTFILTASIENYCISVFLYKTPNYFESQSNNWQIFNMCKDILDYLTTFNYFK